MRTIEFELVNGLASYSVTVDKFDRDLSFLKIKSAPEDATPFACQMEGENTIGLYLGNPWAGLTGARVIVELWGLAE